MILARMSLTLAWEIHTDVHVHAQ